MLCCSLSFLASTELLGRACAMGDDAEEPSQAPSFPEHLRVLVVDDDPLCLMIVAKMLRRCNYEGARRASSV